MKILKMVTGTLIIALALYLKLPEILGLAIMVLGMYVNGMIPYLIKQMKEGES